MKEFEQILTNYDEQISKATKAKDIVLVLRLKSEKRMFDAFWAIIEGDDSENYKDIFCKEADKILGKTKVTI